MLEECDSLEKELLAVDIEREAVNACLGTGRIGPLYAAAFASQANGASWRTSSWLFHRALCTDAGMSESEADLDWSRCGV